MSYLPTPEKLTSLGFTVDRYQTWRAFNGITLTRIFVYAAGFEIATSEGYPNIQTMRFTAPNEAFFDHLIASVASGCAIA